MRIVGGIQDTRLNGEDFALTPFLFSVVVHKTLKLYGIGICWGWWACYIGFSLNLPKEIPSFTKDLIIK